MSAGMETTGEPQQKKVRPTVDLGAPVPRNFEDVWMSPSTEAALTTSEELFGVDRSWFVRASYIRLYNEIMNDGVKSIQIINGTAGIGKSSFLLYMLARLRLSQKPVLLHFHRNSNSPATAVFFPPGRKPEYISTSHNDYMSKFEAWHKVIGEHESVFLVDGIVSFVEDDIPGVKYVVARSPSCSIGYMEKDQNRFDRWLDFWSRPELVSYATLSGIADAEAVIDDNLYHIGGVARYAFQPKAAQEAILNAISILGARELLKVVTTHLTSKYDQQRVVDRLLHRHPPQGLVGVYGTTFTFASEFVATRVSMALAMETNIETAQLLNAFKGIGAAGSMRGILFEAYSARKLAAGGPFTVKEIGSETETTLDLFPSTIVQKDTKILNKTNYPTQEIIEKVVWPNPDYNMPAIDVFMVRSLQCMAFQMTVATNHGLDIKGTKAFLRYSDSIMRELKQPVPQQYPLYFTVPRDIWDKFSNVYQSITGPNGVVLNNADSKKTGNRLQQFLMKIE